jgi:hypothetical protein
MYSALQLPISDYLIKLTPQDSQATIDFISSLSD